MNEFQVTLLANTNGLIRRVSVPDQLPADDEAVLDLVFQWGQNDFQPQEMPSVSCGDVIHYKGEKWLVDTFGFKKITTEQFDALCLEAERLWKSYGISNSQTW